MTWVSDKAILKLFDQLNSVAPNRSKISDGRIGDEEHKETVSDHNPETRPGNPPNQVDAGDFTHDPDNNADMNIVANALCASRDRRIGYIIWNHRITGPAYGWRWVPYYGKNPHTKHMHVSVNDLYPDDTREWQIGIKVLTDEDIKKLLDTTISVGGTPWKVRNVLGNLQTDMNQVQGELNTIKATFNTFLVSRKLSDDIVNGVLQGFKVYSTDQLITILTQILGREAVTNLAVEILDRETPA